MPKRSYTQADRDLAIATPLGGDELLIRSLNGSESISGLFQYHLELLSENDSIDLGSLIGKPVSISLRLAGDSARHFSGIVSRISQGGRDGVFTSYHAEIVPWLWFLTKTADCRIFQNKTVPDILRQIFTDLKFQEFEFRLLRSYAPREYCVQYRETDFQFVSRLMEDEGIFYFFDHDESGHKMILADDYSVHKPCPDQPAASYRRNEGGWRDEDLIHEWRLEHSLQPGKWAHTDYNFESPNTDLMVAVQGANPYEIYDYPGGFAQRSDGDSLVKVRLQEEIAASEVTFGGSTCRAFRSGYTFDLQDHYRPDLNQPYVLTSIHHRATQGAEFGTGNGSGPELSYTNTFTCIPASISFRPRRLTPKSKVQGCQTAVVVGPAGEEIFTDKYGRVKVQFHWDREGKRDENSSCWVRVAQTWAGKGWGAICIPRIGQEVVVEFLEGDPDRPIVTGCVYNAEQTPPYELPDGQTKTALKTSSSKGGDGFNELRFEDEKGKEQVFIHAERNLDFRTKKDRFEMVGEESHLKIGKDSLSEIGGDQHATITGDRNEKVNGTASLTTGQDLHTKVGSTYAMKAGTEIHLNAGTNLVIESGVGLTLKAGGNFISFTAAGISISGTMVMINSGGSPGSGSGCSAEAPKLPKDADNAKPGAKTVARPKRAKTEPTSANAVVLVESAKTGVPFCEICNRK